jgi:predicted alpha/beta-fold hydrolase
MTPPLYIAPLWLPSGHLQTIVPTKFGRLQTVRFERERWAAPDGDFVDLDLMGFGTGSASEAGHDAPLLVLFHGLEGSSASHYAVSTMALARARGWQGAVPHFRSCSGSMNLGPRFYHSGDSTEIDWILRRLRARHRGKLFVVGISLGGNALLRWLGERGEDSAALVDAAAAVSAPVNLAAGGQALSGGFNMVYTRSFLKTMKRKGLQKLEQFPGLFDRETMLRARDLHDFDDIVTAPLHGYRDADDYWHRASAIHVLGEITVPTLVLNARNDPFLPAHALPTRAQVSAAVELEQPATGGHVGFMTGAFPGRLDWLGNRLLHFFDAFTQ